MKKILLIEDNKDILENMAEILELAGFEVCKAENGKDGFQQALREQPHLIVSDIMMPGLDGFGLLHLIRKREELRDVPFIFLTAKTGRVDFRKGMEMGADDFITKPFNDTELLNAIESRLEKEEKRIDKTQQQAFTPFSVNDSKEIQALFNSKEKNKYKKKEIVFTEDNIPYFLFYITKGKLKAYKISEMGKELIVGLYGENEFIGYTALLENGKYSVSVKALEDSEILLIPKRDFLEKIHNDTSVAMFFIRLLAKKNNQKVDQMIQLAYASVRKRVANAILFLKRTYNPDTEESFSIRMTREELSHLAGTTTESLIRMLSDFKKEKLIKIKNNRIIIVNEKKLNRILD